MIALILQVALSSMRCYAQMHNYSFIVVNDADYRQECPHEDVGHCLLLFSSSSSSAVTVCSPICCIPSIGSFSSTPISESLTLTGSSLIVFLSYRLIEEFLSPQHSIILYERFYNWEVAAGSYLVRNDAAAHKFLNEFANWEFRLPDSFHGTDNGALHVSAFISSQLQALFLSRSGVDEKRARICHRLWNASTWYDGLFRFEACVWALLGERREIGPIKVILLIPRSRRSFPKVEAGSATTG